MRFSSRLCGLLIGLVLFAPSFVWGVLDDPPDNLLTEVAGDPNITITIDASKIVGTLPARYRSTAQADVFPQRTDALAQRGKDLGLQYVRMDHLLENAVTSEVSGAMTFDWTRSDADLEQVIKMGATPIVCLSYMPGPLQQSGDNGLIRAPKDFALWEELVYQFAKRYNVEKNYGIKYWEVWNEPNSPGFWADTLANYLLLYDASEKGLRRANPNAKIGGPAIAGGPLSEPWYGANNGDTYVRGLLQHCADTGAKLDFISWHEYGWPSEQYRREARIIKDWLAKDFPQLPTPELLVTEWNFSWGNTEGNDTRVGATWACNTLFRGFLPSGVDVPCFFMFQDHNGDPRFRGYWGMLTSDGIPKAQYNVFKMIDWLGDRIVQSDDDVSKPFYYDIGIAPTVFSDSADLAILCWYNWVGGEDRQFTARWSGQIHFPEAGAYTIKAEMDDGYYFKIGDDVLHSDLSQGWHQDDFQRSYSVSTVDFLLEYHEVLANAKARLSWIKPSGVEEVIGEQYFLHDGQARLLGQYYSGPDFDKLEITRVDRRVNFDWGWGGSPFAGPLGVESPYNVSLQILNAPYATANMERYAVSLTSANAAEAGLSRAELVAVQQIQGVTYSYRPTFSIANHNVMLLKIHTLTTPTSTPTVTPTPTDTPTPTNTPTSTYTDTPTDTPTPTFTYTNTPTPTPKSVDFNHDGKVDHLDLLELVRSIGTGDERFDLNGDGLSDYLDLIVFSQNWKP